MAYGIPPQLYPYLYAPKSSLNLHTSSLESSSEGSVHNIRHKSSKEYTDDAEEKTTEENLSPKDEVLDENENVEID